MNYKGRKQEIPQALKREYNKQCADKLNIFNAKSNFLNNYIPRWTKEKQNI